MGKQGKCKNRKRAIHGKDLNGSDLRETSIKDGRQIQEHSLRLGVARGIRTARGGVELVEGGMGSVRGKVFDGTGRCGKA